MLPLSTLMEQSIQMSSKMASEQLPFPVPVPHEALLPVPLDKTSEVFAVEQAVRPRTQTRSLFLLPFRCR